jgi:hypothetical protein
LELTKYIGEKKEWQERHEAVVGLLETHGVKAQNQGYVSAFFIMYQNPLNKLFSV